MSVRYFICLVCLIVCACSHGNSDKSSSENQQKNARNASGDPATGILHDNGWSLRNPEHDQADADPLQHWLLLSEEMDDESYEDDSKLRLGGGYYQGTVVVRVNGSPMSIRAVGGEVFPISAFLLDGKNEVEFEGDAKVALFAKIITLHRPEFQPPEWLFREVVAKSRFNLKDDRKSRLVFEASVRSPAPFEAIPGDGASRRKQKEELSAVCDQFLDHIANHDVEAASRLSIPINEMPKVGPSAEEVKAVSGKLTELVEDPDLSIVSKSEEVQFVFGDRSVLAYSGFTRFSREAYFAQLEKEAGDGTPAVSPYLEPLIFVRWKGEWKVW